ncbi:MAG: ChaN family lipoprotein [Candidatus Aminicenantes bacterium]|nr:ChaN family lipoprotein [Candidatus Aminicenantes bacterium]
MKKQAKLPSGLAFLFLLSHGISGQTLDPRWLFAFGDPGFKDQTVEIVPGQIVSMATGNPLSFEDMIREMKPVPFILIGESHDSLPTHEIQDRIIRALFEQNERLTVGLEMVAAERQEILNGWGSGGLTEEEFLKSSKWL